MTKNSAYRQGGFNFAARIESVHAPSASHQTVERRPNCFGADRAILTGSRSLVVFATDNYSAVSHRLRPPNPDTGGSDGVWSVNFS